ncbi:MAG: transcription antitermination factor NusB [Spirochaetia bacterium]|nr:transcription antitermination factor NusB [Spirochaetia bacterium]
MRTRHKARELAIQTLYALDFNHILTKEHIPPHFSGVTDLEYAELEQEVKLYAHYLVQGTIENLAQVDELISQFSLNRPLERIDIVDRNVLRISVFCLLYGDIHPHIIIDEAVKLSQDFSTEVNYKFINGMLDTMQKQLFPLKGKTEHDSTENL